MFEIEKTQPQLSPVSRRQSATSLQDVDLGLQSINTVRHDTSPDQTAFDKTTVRAALVSGIALIRHIGSGSVGPDAGVWQISTTSPKLQLMLKPKGDQQEQVATEIGDLVGINTPNSVLLDIDGDPELRNAVASVTKEPALKGKTTVMVQSDGGRYARTSADGSKAADLGGVMMYDILTGNPDRILEQDEDSEVNDKANVLHHQGRVAAIDNGMGKLSIETHKPWMAMMMDSGIPMREKRSLLESLEGLIENSTALSSAIPIYLQRHHDDLKYDAIQRLLAQKGLLSTLEKIVDKEAEIKQAINRLSNETLRDNSLERLEALKSLAAKEAFPALLASIDTAIKKTQQEVEQRKQAQREKAAQPKSTMSMTTSKKAERGATKKQSDGCCYLTTACVQYHGLADDCEQLEMLRSFRDHSLLQQPGGQQLVALYYDIAPAIVDGIDQSASPAQIYAEIFAIINDCIAALKRNDTAYTFQRYCQMVTDLRQRFAA